MDFVPFSSWQKFNLYFLFFQVVRLACYSFKLYGCLKGEKPWQAAGSQLSTARMILRLFDDIPMIRHTYSYGLGKHVSILIKSILRSMYIIFKCVRDCLLTRNRNIHTYRSNRILIIGSLAKNIIILGITGT